MKSEELCDLGKYKEFIIPPYIVRAPKNKSHLAQLTSKPEWMKPIFVITNVKSGSNDADKIISGFRSVLNPLQILSLNPRDGPKKILNFIAKLNCKSRLLIVGGDGTICWVLSTIQEIKFEVSGIWLNSTISVSNLCFSLNRNCVAFPQELETIYQEVI